MAKEDVQKVFPTVSVPLTLSLSALGLRDLTLVFAACDNPELRGSASWCVNQLSELENTDRVRQTTMVRSTAISLRLRVLYAGLHHLVGKTCDAATGFPKPELDRAFKIRLSPSVTSFGSKDIYRDYATPVFWPSRISEYNLYASPADRDTAIALALPEFKFIWLRVLRYLQTLCFATGLIAQHGRLLADSEYSGVFHDWDGQPATQQEYLDIVHAQGVVHSYLPATSLDSNWTPVLPFVSGWSEAPADAGDLYLRTSSDLGDFSVPGFTSVETDVVLASVVASRMLLSEFGDESSSLPPASTTAPIVDPGSFPHELLVQQSVLDDAVYGPIVSAALSGSSIETDRTGDGSEETYLKIVDALLEMLGLPARPEKLDNAALFVFLKHLTARWPSFGSLSEPHLKNAAMSLAGGDSKDVCNKRHPRPAHPKRKARTNSGASPAFTTAVDWSDLSNRERKNAHLLLLFRVGVILLNRSGCVPGTRAVGISRTFAPDPLTLSSGTSHDEYFFAQRSDVTRAVPENYWTFCGFFLPKGNGSAGFAPWAMSSVSTLALDRHQKEVTAFATNLVGFAPAGSIDIGDGDDDESVVSVDSTSRVPSSHYWDEERPYEQDQLLSAVAVYVTGRAYNRELETMAHRDLGLFLWIEDNSEESSSVYFRKLSALRSLPGDAVCVTSWLRLDKETADPYSLGALCAMAGIDMTQSLFSPNPTWALHYAMSRHQLIRDESLEIVTKKDLNPICEAPLNCSSGVIIYTRNSQVVTPIKAAQDSILALTSERLAKVAQLCVRFDSDDEHADEFIEDLTAIRHEISKLPFELDPNVIKKIISRISPEKETEPPVQASTGVIGVDELLIRASKRAHARSSSGDRAPAMDEVIAALVKVVSTLGLESVSTETCKRVLHVIGTNDDQDEERGTDSTRLSELLASEEPMLGVGAGCSRIYRLIGSVLEILKDPTSPVAPLLRFCVGNVPTAWKTVTGRSFFVSERLASGEDREDREAGVPATHGFSYLSETRFHRLMQSGFGLAQSSLLSKERAQHVEALGVPVVTTSPVALVIESRTELRPLVVLPSYPTDNCNQTDLALTPEEDASFAPVFSEADLADLRSDHRVFEGKTIGKEIRDVTERRRELLTAQDVLRRKHANLRDALDSLRGLARSGFVNALVDDVGHFDPLQIVPHYDMVRVARERGQRTLLGWYSAPQFLTIQDYLDSGFLESAYESMEDCSTEDPEKTSAGLDPIYAYVFSRELVSYLDPGFSVARASPGTASLLALVHRTICKKPIIKIARNAVVSVFPGRVLVADGSLKWLNGAPLIDAMRFPCGRTGIGALSVQSFSDGSICVGTYSNILENTQLPFAKRISVFEEYCRAMTDTTGGNLLCSSARTRTEHGVITSVLDWSLIRDLLESPMCPIRTSQARGQITLSTRSVFGRPSDYSARGVDSIRVPASICTPMRACGPASIRDGVFEAFPEIKPAYEALVAEILAVGRPGSNVDRVQPVNRSEYGGYAEEDEAEDW